MSNLLDAVLEAMQTDDANREKQSARLVSLYNCSTVEMRAAMDCAFVALCGWSIATLIEQSKQAALEALYDDYFDRTEKANRVPLIFTMWRDKIHNTTNN